MIRMKSIILLVVIFNSSIRSADPSSRTRMRIPQTFHKNFQLSAFSLVPVIDHNFIPIADKEKSEIPPVIKREFDQLKSRMEKIEKSQDTSSRFTGFLDSLKTNSFELTTRNVQVCSIISFFFIGSVIGASLLENLWLIGGIVMAWWAAEVFNTDTRGGVLTRRVGLQIAQWIRDLQEKYRQMQVFYTTGVHPIVGVGKIASKVWDYYDTQFSITQRVDKFKALAIQRAAEVNTLFEGRDLSGQLYDVWQVLLATPVVVQRFDTRFGITSSLLNFGAGAVTTTSTWLSSLLGKDGAGPGDGRPETRGRGGKGSSSRGYNVVSGQQQQWWFLRRLEGLDDIRVKKESDGGARGGRFWGWISSSQGKGAGGGAGGFLPWSSEKPRSDIDGYYGGESDSGLQGLRFLENFGGLSGVALRKAARLAESHFLTGRRRQRLAAIRGRPINPWTLPFDYLPGCKRSSQRNDVKAVVSSFGVLGKDVDVATILNTYKNRLRRN